VTSASRHRLALVVVIAALLVVAAPAWAESASPRIALEVATLASAVDADAGASVSFVSTDSSLHIIRDHAWILTLWVEDAPAYGGLYFTLSEIDGRRTGELISGPGVQGTRAMTGDALAEYLARVGLDDAPIRAAFERHHRRRDPR
jgi:hypothetical protein